MRKNMCGMSDASSFAFELERNTSDASELLPTRVADLFYVPVLNKGSIYQMCSGHAFVPYPDSQVKQQ